jgi:hypothetical protein
VIALAARVLLRLWWTDVTNVAGGWHDAEALDEFATNGAWAASNTGWLVYEDEHCYVLAGRMTDDGNHAGLVERVPKTAVTRKEVLAGPRAGGEPARAPR